MINFTNSASTPIDRIMIHIPEVPFLRIEASEAPQQLNPGESKMHVLQLECLQPFLQPPKYMVQFTMAGQSQPTQLPLTLPTILTKFMMPVDLTTQQFVQHYEGMQGPQRESQMTSQAKLPPEQWRMYLTKAFNLQFVPQETPGVPVMSAAGLFHTNTPQPNVPGKTISVACMARIEYAAEQKMARITVRAAHPQCAQALGQIMATYLLVPPGQGQGQ